MLASSTICFASLHALGKYVEESGIDSNAVEKVIYSPGQHYARY
jgi:hypothetical protein